MSLKEEIRSAILQATYAAYFPGISPAPLRDLREGEGWEQEPFRRVVDEMTDDRLIKFFSTSMRYIITGYGIQYAERERIGPAQLYEMNERVRTALILFAYEHYREHGRGRAVLYSDVERHVCEQTGCDDRTVHANVFFLQTETGLIEFQHTGAFELTLEGRAIAEQFQARRALYAELEELESGESVTPQERGRRFQALFAQLAEQQGWDVEGCVATEGEEVDIFISRGCSFYLVETKWETKKVGSAYVRDFAGKVSERPGAHGIFVSMSGFTKGAVTKARQRIASTPMMFFGSKDVDTLFSLQRSLDEMITDKYQAIVKRQTIAFE